jgi:hypothetical protein
LREGYGRGYYGEGQLARTPQPRGSGWFKVALVLGVGGAAAWYFWWRKPKLELPLGTGIQLAQEKTLVFDAIPSSHAIPSSSHAVAASRGFPSQQEYEDGIVAMAKHLQDTGAKIELAPHFTHLAPRIAPPVPEAPRVPVPLPGLLASRTLP